MGFNTEFLDILACPVCRGDLLLLSAKIATEPAKTTEVTCGATFGAAPESTVEAECGEDTAVGLACPACALVYPIRDSIPVLLPGAAVRRAEWDKGCC